MSPQFSLSGALPRRRLDKSTLVFFTFFGALCVVATVMVTAFFKDYQHRANWRALQHQKARLLGETLARPLARELYFGDVRRLVPQLAGTLSAHPDVMDVLVVNKQGTVALDLYSNRRGEKWGENLKKPALDYLRLPLVWSGSRTFGLGLKRVKVGWLHLGIAPGDPNRGQQLEAMVSVAQDLAGEGARAVQRGEWVELSNLLGDMARNNPGILYSQLLLPDGTVVFYASARLPRWREKKLEGKPTTDPLAKKALSRMALRPLQVTPVRQADGAEVMDVAVSLSRGGKALGLLRLGHSMASLKRAEDQRKLRLGALALLCVLLAAAAATWVSHHMSDLLKGLDDSNLRSTALYQDKRNELLAALKVQRNLLPPFEVDYPPLRLRCHYQPASELCGDFFDVVEKPGYLAVIMADVSGHGAGSAIVMSSLITLFRQILENLPTGALPHPARLLKALDRAMTAQVVSPDLHHATALCAVFNPVTRQLALSRAGHAPPWLLSPGLPPHCLEGPALPPLNIMGFLSREPEDYRHIAQLHPGDKVLLYTDGVTEFIDKTGDLWGEEGLEKVLRENAHQHADELLRTIAQAVVRESGQPTPRDDQALVVLEWPVG